MKALDMAAKEDVIVGISHTNKKVTLYKNIFDGPVAQDNMSTEELITVFARIITSASDVIDPERVIFKESLVLDLEEAMKEVMARHTK